MAERSTTSAERLSEAREALKGNCFEQGEGKRDLFLFRCFFFIEGHADNFLNFAKVLVVTLHTPEEFS